MAIIQETEQLSEQQRPAGGDAGSRTVPRFYLDVSNGALSKEGNLEV